MKKILLIVGFFYLSVITMNCEKEGSLVFVIDDTNSMREDIELVKDAANDITAIVFNSNSSQIDDLVLITFNDDERPIPIDPFFKVHIKTKDRVEFKKSVDSLYAHADYNYNCPEQSLMGIDRGLNESRPRSYLYVFTDDDASSVPEDPEVAASRIERSCQSKESQIVFVLTPNSHCPEAYKTFKYYYDIAGACAGQVFRLKAKADIEKVLKYVKETISGRRSVITSRILRPHQFEIIHFTTDDQMEYAIFSSSGKDVRVEVKTTPSPGTYFEKLVYLDNVKVLKLYEPGTYKISVMGGGLTSVMVFGKTDFTFTHGFSETPTKSLQFTSKRPILDKKMHLSVKLNQVKGDVNVSHVRLLSMDETLLDEKPLKLTDDTTKFYSTDAFVAPRDMFKIQIVGIKINTMETITRMSPTPITPQTLSSVVESPHKTPEIFIKHKVINAEYNQPLELQCKVSGYPKPDIIWIDDASGDMLSNQVLDIEYPYDYINVLNLPDIHKNNTYTCQAANYKGLDIQHVEIVTVKKIYFNILKQPNDTNIEYRTNATLECDADANPPAEITWHMVTGGLYSEIKNNSHFELSPNNSKLTVKDMQPSMKGQYSCEVRNENNNITYQFNLGIDGVEKPQIYKGNAPFVYAPEGSSATLYCSILKGIPSPRITWYFKAQNSSNFIRYNIYLNDMDEKGIKLLNVRRHETGIYKCEAENELGKDTLEQNLEVQYPPTVTISNKQVTLLDGNAIILNCEVNGKPSPDVKWFKYDKQILDGPKYTILPDHSLRFRADTSDHGIYICNATNNLGSANDMSEVIVHTKPVIDQTKSPFVYAREGSAATLICSILKGTPSPEITWYYQRPESSNQINLKKSDTEVRFANVQRDKTGIYKCVAENEVGKDSLEQMFEVQYPPTVTLSDKYLKEEDGNTITLSCEVGGMPSPEVKWFQNNIEIFNGPKFKIFSNHVLRFKVNTGDSGVYTCQAINDLGSANDTSEVLVYSPPQIMIPAKTTLEKKLGDKLDLECIVDGFPKPNITWKFTNNTSISPVSWRNIAENITSLIITKLKTESEGIYMCIAQVYDKVVSLTYNVTVIVPLTIEDGARKFVAVTGDAALRIPCRAHGSPKPTVSWITYLKAKFKVYLSKEDIDDDGTLNIRDIDSAASGHYTCEAANKLEKIYALYEVIVQDYPSEVFPIKKVTIDEGSSNKLNCDLPQTLTDTVRWYKDGTTISNVSVLVLENASYTSEGIYTCRVSNLDGAKSASVQVIVRKPPKFKMHIEDDVILIEFARGSYQYLDCETDNPDNEQVEWYHNKALIGYGNHIYVIDDMHKSDQGEYKCVVSNDVASIMRLFRIEAVNECYIPVNIEENQPFVLSTSIDWASYPNIEGYITIPTNEVVVLSCMKGFKDNDSYQTEITATCVKEYTFSINGSQRSIVDIKCNAKAIPTQRRTQKKCLMYNNSEILKIGYDNIGRKFLEVYEICINKENSILSPTYTKLKMNKSFVNKIYGNNGKWFYDSSNLSAMYDCDRQRGILDKTLGEDFHPYDNCCFKNRQLVNPRDLSLGQSSSTFVFLNVAPQWSSCNSKNWDELEHRVRGLAKTIKNDLVVYTGVLQQLTINNTNIFIENKYGKRRPVPLYFWKVVSDPKTKSSLAIIQLNVPDVTVNDIYSKGYVFCDDVCKDIQWMHDQDWMNVEDGYTFCCKTDEFDKKAGFNNLFRSGLDDYLDPIGFSYEYLLI